MTDAGPIRVAHVTTAHQPTDNRIFRKQCRALANAGFDVTLVAVAPADAELDGVHLITLPEREGRLRRMVRGPLDVWKQLKRLDPEIIQGHDPELIPLLVAWRLSHPRSKVFYDSHEDLPKQVAGKPYLPATVRPMVAMGARVIERMAGRTLDGIVVATPSIEQNFGRTRTGLVQNFPWLRDYPKPEPAPVTGVRRVVYTGSLSNERGLSEMLTLAEHLPEGAELVLVGPSSPLLEAKIRASVGRVSFLGLQPPESIPALLATSHVGLAILHPLPNYLKSQATKIFEYMAAGRPFVASNFPAWVDMFGSFDCGIFVDPLDESAVRNAVLGLLDNPGRAAAMGQRGRQALEDHFTFEHEADRLIDFYGGARAIGKDRA